MRFDGTRDHLYQNIILNTLHIILNDFRYDWSQTTECQQINMNNLLFKIVSINDYMLDQESREEKKKRRK